MIYLDYAATSLYKPRTVHRAVAHGMKIAANPGRGGHRLAMHAAEEVFAAREVVGGYFGATPQNTVFTKNDTEALNIAIKGLAPKQGDIVISSLEHNSVFRPAMALENDERKVRVFAVDPAEPERTLRHFRVCCQKGKVGLVVCTAASNVCGALLPVRAIGKYCREHGIPFIVDAAVTAGILPTTVSRLYADVICVPGHKSLYGPQGSGALLTAGTYSVAPLCEGGSGGESERVTMPENLPERLEAGTLNVPAILGFAAGVDFVARHQEKRGVKEAELISAAAAELRRMGYTLVGHVPYHTAPILSFVLPSVDSETLAALFDDAGFALRGGLHCAPLAHETLGTKRYGTLRLSPGAFTTEAEITAFLRAAQKIRKNH